MITGAMLRDGLISAANNITNNKTAVDALNVFPVPDGDTGTNMALTMQAAAKELQKIPNGEHISKVADMAASALIRGARGNSGVILSLIFKGMAEGLKGCIEASGTSIAAALQLGSDNAYKSVMKPTEGTILTVIRISAERAAAKAATGSKSLEVFLECCEAAKTTLSKTPEMLVELRRAKVVDAGGQGLVLIFEAMYDVFCGGGIIPLNNSANIESNKPILSEYTAQFANDNIKFSYCTEFIINKNAKSFLDALLLRSYLETIGDCVVVVEDNDIIKVHVHSNEPGNVLTKALEYGSLVNVKIDNMRQQHQNASWGIGEDVREEEAAYGDEDGEDIIEKQYGFVTISAGEGLDNIFTELGADINVSGGQTMNPSTEEILNAVSKIRAEHIFILPNNKNIILAAKQVIPLTKKSISVIPTVNIPQGIAAMLRFDETADFNKNLKEMTDGARSVDCIQITYAARDSYLNGQAVRKDDILGMENGKITLVDKDYNNAAFRCAKKRIHKNTSMISIFYGADVSEEDAEALAERMRHKLTRAEISVIYGAQPVYYYIISIE